MTGRGRSPYQAATTPGESTSSPASVTSPILGSGQSSSVQASGIYAYFLKGIHAARRMLDSAEAHLLSRSSARELRKHAKRRQRHAAPSRRWSTRLSPRALSGSSSRTTSPRALVHQRLNTSSPCLAGLNPVVAEPYDRVLSQPRGTESSHLTPSEELWENVNARRPSRNRPRGLVPVPSEDAVARNNPYTSSARQGHGGLDRDEHGSAPPAYSRYSCGPVVVSSSLDTAWTTTESPTLSDLSDYEQGYGEDPPSYYADISPPSYAQSQRIRWQIPQPVRVNFGNDDWMLELD